MQQYNVTLKSLLQTSGLFVLERLAGAHFELQSTNNPHMPLRMAEYALGVYRQFGSFPRQLVLYVDEPTF